MLVVEKRPRLSSTKSVKGVARLLKNDVTKPHVLMIEERRGASPAKGNFRGSFLLLLESGMIV